MSFLDIITLFVVMASLAALPSSSVALVVTRSITLNAKNGIAVAIGVTVGDLLFVALAVFGLSAAAQALGDLLLVIKVIGGIYLTWLGYCLLRTRSEPLSLDNSSSGSKDLFASTVAGFVLTLGDVKAIFFYVSLFPVFVTLPIRDAVDIATIALITVLSVGGVKVAYAIFAKQVINAFRLSASNSYVQKAGGFLLVGVGIGIVVQTIGSLF